MKLSVVSRVRDRGINEMAASKISSGVGARALVSVVPEIANHAAQESAAAAYRSVSVARVAFIFNSRGVLSGIWCAHE